MLGTIIYAILDVSANVVWFAGKITIQTVSSVITYAFKDKTITDKELDEIRQQLLNKKKVMKELELVYHYANK
jgi:hypothetical protein